VFVGSPPIAFTFGLGGLAVFPLRFGASAVLIESATPPNLVKIIEAYKATVCFTAPTAYRAMLAAMDEGADLSSLRVAISAGETLPAPVYEAWTKRTGVPILDGIGSTEMLHVFIANRLHGVVTPSCGCGPTRSRITERMKKISYSGYRFPPEIIHQAIWLYLRFTLSLRDVEDLLAERGVPVSYETVRRWVNHFGPMIAADLRKRRMKPHTTWHLDEVYLKIDGRMVYLWRAVDAEGEVLDVLVQSKRNKHAALKLMRKLLKKYAFVPERLVTDDLRSYSAAARDLGIERRHERGRWNNNRAENSHQPTRRRARKMRGFKSVGSTQRFLSMHAAALSTCNVQRHLTSSRTRRAFRASAI